MYRLTKEMEIAGAHCLRLPYESKCQNIHGHNWRVRVEIEGMFVTDYKMLLDFTHIKSVVNQLDHAYINEVLGETNPTAENIAYWLFLQINKQIVKAWANEPRHKTRPVCVRVVVQESQGNVAEYTSRGKDA